MSDDYPPIDCHKCKDLEFARNLAVQMREGYGRHNSNLAFRSQPMRRSDGIPFVIPILHIRESQQARVIGSIGGRALRYRWQDCEVGDAVPATCLDWPSTSAYWVMALPRPLHTHYVEGDESRIEEGCERRTFERIRWRFTNTGGRTWSDETFWKRLS